MTNTPTGDGKFGDLFYDEVIVEGPDGEQATLPLTARRHEPITVDQVAEWEVGAFPALARHRAEAASTPIDDALPENPQDHLDELRSIPATP